MHITNSFHEKVVAQEHAINLYCILWRKLETDFFMEIYVNTSRMCRLKTGWLIY